ncbi:hypothetical protein MVEG_10732 [Podila verticillata NRRL 6337]|nr:hypothetical protein MVEG_10732 [Podila verticillata NRRL 6337]
MSTPTSLTSLEKYTWSSPLAPAMEPEEFVYILSCLQPYVDMARLCRTLQLKTQRNPLEPTTLALALSCMNQYELRRACQDWKSVVVHIDPECTALQKSVTSRYKSTHFWATVQAVIWGGALAAVGLGQNSIIRHIRWPASKLASVCVALLGCLVTVSCAVKTTKSIKAIPKGYDVIKVGNEGPGHLFLIRRDFSLKSNPRIVPMYLLSGLGLGTMALGARLAFKIRKV